MGFILTVPEQKRGWRSKRHDTNLKTSCDYVGGGGKRCFYHFYKGRRRENIKRAYFTFRQNRVNGIKFFAHSQAYSKRMLALDGTSISIEQVKFVPNSQLYKQAGNGIVVNVFAEILKGLIEVQNGS